MLYNRYDFIEIASVAYRAGNDYQESVSEFLVVKHEKTGRFYYAEIGYCSCCGPDYRDLALTPLELGSFILAARRWARKSANAEDLENLTSRIKRLIDVVIDYVDGTREKEIDAARVRVQQARETLKELDKIRRAFNDAMAAKMSAAVTQMNSACEELNKLTD